MKAGREKKKLGEVCEIHGGATPSRTDASLWEGGTIPWFTIDDIREQGKEIYKTIQHVTIEGADKLYMHPKNSIMLCCTASVGECAITRIPLTSNQQFNGLFIKDEAILVPEYLYYVATTLKPLLLSLSGKATINFVARSKVEKIVIPVPPIDEQLAIVSELDSLSSIIAKHKQLAEEYDRLEQSIFHDMFGDPVTNDNGWEVKKLGELTKEKPTYGSMASAVEYDGETRYVRITDIDNNGDLLPNKMSPSIVEDKYLLKDGDIVFARSGATVGKTYCYLNTNERMIYAGYLIKFVPDDKYVIPIYLSFYTKTDFYKSFIQSNAQAVAQPNINAKQYSNLDVLVPPLSLQTLFAEKIQHIEAMKAANAQAQKEAETLFAERMNYYFGE